MTGGGAVAEDERESQQEFLEQRSAAIIAGIEAIDPDHVTHLATSTRKIVLSHFIDGPGAPSWTACFRPAARGGRSGDSRWP